MREKKIKARSAVAVALAAGRLTKGPCSVCGSVNQVEGHHEDYDKPLQVVWLCRKHHNELHVAELAAYEPEDTIATLQIRPAWACRHCKHEWLAVNVNKPPKQCPNRKCRAADWNRPKIKSGRPRKPGKKR